jgi:hypothetical protein
MLTNQETLQNQLPLSRIASTCLDKSPPEAPHNPTHLKGTIPFLVFSLEITSNNLIYEGNGYTSYQLFLLTLVSTHYVGSIVLIGI